MLKFFLGLVIVVITTFCGRLLAGKYRRRKDFFVQMNEFNDRFLTEVTYYKRPLIEFFEGFQYHGEFQELLEEVMAIRKGSGVLKGASALIDFSRFTFLTADERVLIGDYFLTIGKGDSLSQKTYFGGIKENLSSIRKRCEEENKKYGELYLKLGFLCGLAILVLIV